MNVYYEDDRVILYHGDCREIIQSIGDSQVHTVITDPPYGVTKSGQMLGQISSNYHAKGTHSRGYADHDPEEFERLLSPVFNELQRITPPGRAHVVFGGTRTIHQVASMAERTGLIVIDQIAFIGGGTYAKSKTTLVPSYEPALLIRSPGKPHEINPARVRANVLDSRKGSQESDHPTTKPSSWMRWTVDLTSREGETVLDPFAGSGSTLVAAKMLGRRAIGIEIEERYCEIAAARLAQEAFDFSNI